MVPHKRFLEIDNNRYFILELGPIYFMTEPHHCLAKATNTAWNGFEKHVTYISYPPQKAHLFKHPGQGDGRKEIKTA